MKKYYVFSEDDRDMAGNGEVKYFVETDNYEPQSCRINFEEGPFNTKAEAEVRADYLYYSNLK